MTKMVIGKKHQLINPDKYIRALVSFDYICKFSNHII